MTVVASSVTRRFLVRVLVALALLSQWQLSFLASPVGDPFMRILLIDDDPTVLEIVSLMLSSLRHLASPPSNPRDGLPRLEVGESVDLVLTDFAMPGINGLEVVRRIRLRWPRLAVGIITGSLAQLPVPHPMLDVLITKPVDLVELRQAIERLRP